MNLNRKQKVLLPLIILAFAYVLWQLYDLFGVSWMESKRPPAVHPISAKDRGFKGNQLAPIMSVQKNSGENSSISQVSLVPAKNPLEDTNAQIKAATQKTPAINNSNTTAVNISKQPAAIKTSPATSSTSIAMGSANANSNANTQSNLSAQQLEYLQLVNQYQIVRLQRMILDEQAAMAAARERITQEGGNTEPANSALPIGDYQTGSTDYKLMYIDFQKGQWTATLSKMGQYFEVTTGTLLLDGTRVIGITHQGVILQEGDQKVFLNFFGSKIITDSALPSVSANSSSPVSAGTTILPSNTLNNYQMAVVHTPSSDSPSATLKEAKTNNRDSQQASPAKNPVVNTPVLASNHNTTNDLVLALPVAHFTLQLQSGRKREVLEEYIKHHHLENTYLITINSYHKPWYLLIQGDYATLTQAISAINNLPKRVQADKPWIRSIGSIQTAIKKAK